MFARIQAVLLGIIVFVAFTQVGAHIGAERTAERRARRTALDATVRDLARFVADAHGAPFRRPVRADLLGDKAFERALGGDGDTESGGGPDDFGATMVGLGLAGEDDDPYEASEAAMTDDVVGFYDSESERLFVRGTRITPYTRLVLVHELVHAWQDQHFDLDEVQDIDDSDAWTAAHALVEGDAMRIENAWRESRPRGEQRVIDAVEDSGGRDDREMSRAEVTLSIMYDFPYAAGEAFATALYETGGNRAIGTAFRAPPTSTEQVLHPEKYLAGDDAVRVDAPKPDGSTLDEGVLGELGLLLLVMRGEWDDDAFAAVSGWAGDRYVTWEKDDSVCTRAHVRMETPAARNRLVKALRAKASGDARIVPSGPVAADLRYCADAA